MSDFVTGLLDLWTDDHGSRSAAEAAFLEWYVDPVLVNGVPFSIAAMVDRADEVRARYPDAPREVLDVLETPDKVAVAFRLGPNRVIDILTLTEGRISSIWMVAAPEE